MNGISFMEVFFYLMVFVYDLDFDSSNEFRLSSKPSINGLESRLDILLNVAALLFKN